jgi:microcystin degradation protein MlrC
VISGPVDRETAARVAEPLLKKMWETRAETSLVSGGPESICSTARQLAASGQRVLIADFSDNPGGGGYGTTTALLAALLRSAGPPAVFAPLCDPSAASVCAQAGVGSNITITLGATPDTPFSGPRLTLSGKIAYCADTRFRAVGPMWTHRKLRLGMTAVVACGTVDVVIASFPLQVTEPAYLEAAGIDLERKPIIAIKSLQHFRAAFASRVDAILFADSGGLVSNEYRRFPYARVRRPIWPLDEDVERQ